MIPAKNTETPILSVTELNQYARGVLEMHVGKIAVTGEISNFSQPASGHWYFTLKDANAQIRCAMFRNKNQFLRIKPANGMQIIINGAVSIYEGRGEYQLIADYLEEAGTGALQKQFELLKAKLAAEGLFDSQFKQKLPTNPQHIAVVTSATGAAIHDILSVLNERFPLLRITLIPCTVQGSLASNEICQAIALAERWNSENLDSIDAIIVGRGGGPIEDLWPFNEENVARAIFSCKIPVISAVGHEVDTTIADYVADVRAPTPSAAAEIISPDQSTLKQQLDYCEQQLHRHLKSRLAQSEKDLQLFQKSLRHPGERLAQYHFRFLQLKKDLAKTEQQQIDTAKQQLTLLAQRFSQHKPDAAITLNQQHISKQMMELKKSFHRKLTDYQNSLQQQSRLLNTVSPLATLDRGYAIVRNEKKQIIHCAKKQRIGDRISITMSDGDLACTIENINT